jgi:hypothetical protein
MRSWRWVVVMVAAGGVLAGCGSAEPESASGKTASGNRAAAAPSGNATAAEVAKEARGKVKCPAKVQTSHPKDAPVDDVVGVRPGMTYEEAANVVLCTNELLVVNPETSRRFSIQTYGQNLRQGFVARMARDRVQKTSQQILREMQDSAIARSTNRAVRDLNPGESKWYVATMGLPGQERVISAAREEWFEAGRNPTVASVEQALIKKYGTPSKSFMQDRRRKDFLWSYDLRNRLITETSPLFNNCYGTADPDHGTNFSPDCGIAVRAVIVSMQDNPDLAESMQVGTMDKAGGYEAITATERALEQQEAQRRAKAVEDAAKNANAPTL